MSISKKLSMATAGAIFVALGLAGTAQAATLVGSFSVGSGPFWGTNPTVYSAREAAALIFGGNPTDYSISTDPNTINYLAFYDGWADEQYLSNPQPQDFKVDVGNPGYDDPGGFGTAYSAYVGDHSTPGEFVNYVFTNDAQAVPFEFSPGLGILALGACGAMTQLKSKVKKLKSSGSAVPYK